MSNRIETLYVFNEGSWVDLRPYDEVLDNSFETEDGHIQTIITFKRNGNIVRSIIGVPCDITYK